MVFIIPFFGEIGMGQWAKRHFSPMQGLSTIVCARQGSPSQIPSRSRTHDTVSSSHLNDHGGVKG